MNQSNSHDLAAAARALSQAVGQLSFSDPITHVYNPLSYAWKPHLAYLERVGSDVSVLFLGMNPGPWGMAQTGVPFGEVAAVRDWIQIDQPVGKPSQEHDKRPVEGFQCRRSEVSGRRLWGLFQQLFGTPDKFFRHHFVANYCPLVFMEASGRNRTPDKLPVAERERLGAICDIHLASVIEILDPDYLVGVGVYAEACLKRVLDRNGGRGSVVRILHPSPASPAANQDWAGKATRQLKKAGVWN
jgi:single-strand selective monofunctional uracil DNA glycosylase